MAKQEGFVFRIKRDKDGEKLLSDIKKVLNNDSYGIKVRFTGKRDNPRSGHTRKEDATSYRLYINKRWHEDTTPFDYIQRGREIERDQLGERAFNDTIKLEQLEKHNRVLTTKLSLLMEGLKGSTKYRDFVDTVNSIIDIKDNKPLF